MKQRPILFSAPMIRALLNSSKTQTRRIVKPQPLIGLEGLMKWRDSFWYERHELLQLLVDKKCPYGKVGDQLWVRETFMSLANTGVEGRDKEGKRINYAYAAESPPGSYSDDCRKEYGLKWKPSIHMPRIASRITLEITNIRVERLNDCSDEDALAEGVDRTNTSIPGYAKKRYETLWESINGAGSWAANPWVWVVEFKVVKK
jgi:hypothetical protein